MTTLPHTIRLEIEGGEPHPEAIQAWARRTPPVMWRFMTRVEQAARPGALLELIDLVWRPLAAHAPNTRGAVRVELEAQIGRLAEDVRR